MNYIDPKRITWSGSTYSPLPTNSCTMSTSISGTISADKLAEEIDRKLKQIEKEYTMEPEKKTYTDLSPGKSAYVKYLDHIIKINDVMEFNITHERVGEPLRLELVVRDIETQRMTLPDVKIYEAPKIKPYSKRLPIAEDVIFNGPATTIIWADGTKTTVKCQDGEEFNEYIGVETALVKKLLGNKANFNNAINKMVKMGRHQKTLTKVKSSDVLEGETFYSSALKNMEKNINEINDVMRSASEALEKALEGKK